jgi:hypothetical protein
MSAWTHVVGCIRVDGISFLGVSVQKLEQVLGPICTFENWRDDSTLPRGSEGGLQYRVIEYDKGLPWVSIPIWGDLRDFDSADEIEKWWNETLPKLGMIRDAVLHIQVEMQEPKILAWKNP